MSDCLNLLGNSGWEAGTGCLSKSDVVIDATDLGLGYLMEGVEFLLLFAVINCAFFLGTTVTTLTPWNS